jgi:hydrogenase maturation protease
MTVVDSDGEAARLLGLIEGAGHAIIVDATLSGARPGTIHRLDATASQLPKAMFTVSTHAIGLADAIELARALGQLPERCIVYAIEAATFAPGQPLSPDVAAAVDDVIARVLDEIGAEVT